jgi:hypothetical protein
MNLRSIISIRYYTTSSHLTRIRRPYIPDSDPFEHSLGLSNKISQSHYKKYKNIFSFLFADFQLRPIARLFLTGNQTEAKAAIDKFLLFNPSNITAQYLNFWICYRQRETKPQVCWILIGSEVTSVMKNVSDGHWSREV